MKSRLYSFPANGLIAVVLGFPSIALTQSHDPGMPEHQHQLQHQHQAAPMPADARQAVRFPEPLRTHTLNNMRDHLAALGQIQEALSRADYDAAAEMAEQRLGMSSLVSHGAHEVAQFMPQGMQDAGSAMHRSASRFALAAKDASVTGDWKSALGALAQLNQACVACHAGYRLE